MAVMMRGRRTIHLSLVRTNDSCGPSRWTQRKSPGASIRRDSWSLRPGDVIRP